MAVGVGDVLSAAAGFGLGTAASGAVASELAGLAQVVREKAAALATEVDVVAGESNEARLSLGECLGVEWQGVASESFRTSLTGKQAVQGKFSDDVAGAAAEVRVAGESLAVELEMLATSVSVAGRAVDSAVFAVADHAENLADIAEVLRDQSVVFAQAQLDSLMNHPLIASVQRALV